MAETNIKNLTSKVNREALEKTLKLGLHGNVSGSSSSTQKAATISHLIFSNKPSTPSTLSSSNVAGNDNSAASSSMMVYVDGDSIKPKISGKAKKASAKKKPPSNLAHKSQLQEFLTIDETDLVEGGKDGNDDEIVEDKKNILKKQSSLSKSIFPNGGIGSIIAASRNNPISTSTKNTEKESDSAKEYERVLKKEGHSSNSSTKSKQSDNASNEEINSEPTISTTSIQRPESPKLPRKSPDIISKSKYLQMRHSFSGKDSSCLQKNEDIPVKTMENSPKSAPISEGDVSDDSDSGGKDCQSFEKSHLQPRKIKTSLLPSKNKDVNSFLVKSQTVNTSISLTSHQRVDIDVSKRRTVSFSTHEGSL